MGKEWILDKLVFLGRQQEELGAKGCPHTHPSVLKLQKEVAEVIVQAHEEEIAEKCRTCVLVNEGVKEGRLIAQLQEETTELKTRIATMAKALGFYVELMDTDIGDSQDAWLWLDDMARKALENNGGQDA